jgi:hypothetical protein
MISLSELRARVAASYDALGMPSWPDPHPSGGEPRPEEYSRVTGPERYRIVHARARVWTDQLQNIDGVGVDVEWLAPAHFESGGRRFEFGRGARITPARAEALPLFLLERDVSVAGHTKPSAVLYISIVRPGIVVGEIPDCGCDACDRGSDDLLEFIDDTIGYVIGGPFVALRAEHWRAEWHPEGASCGGDGDGPDHREVWEVCRRLAHNEAVSLPTGVEVHVGRSWQVAWT